MASLMYSCMTCRVGFADADLHRGHYKTDWHRYNLKRKVAEMPPVTADNFQQRVLAQKKQVADAEESTVTHCSLCSKHFSTSNAHSNHIQSKKHREAEARQQQQQQQAEAKRKEKLQEKGLEQSASDVNDMVADKNARNLALKQEGQGSRPAGGAAGSSSMDMMEDDADGSDEDCEEWEGEGLGLEQCLFCGHVAADMQQNVQHMVTTHSFFLPDPEYLVDLEGLLTYLGKKVGEGHMCLWCNEQSKAFRSVRAAQQHMVTKGHCKLLHEGPALLEYADFYDYSSSYPDQQAAGDPREEEEEEEEPELLEEANYQLVLPSGAMVGHRSLMRFYRQNLVDRPNRIQTAVSKVMAQYKALGWTGSTGVAAQQRARDLAFVQRLRQHHRTKLAVKANRFQTHFRDDNFGIRH